MKVTQPVQARRQAWWESGGDVQSAWGGPVTELNVKAVVKQLRTPVSRAVQLRPG